MQALGVHPDIIVCRTEKELSPELRHKIAQFCNVKPGHVIQSIDAWSIYQVPLNMEAENLGKMVVDKLEIPGLVEIVEIPSHPFFIATQFHPEFKSTPEHPQPLFVHFVKACMDKR